MTKNHLTYLAAFVLCIFSLADVFAQTTDVLRKLNEKFDQVREFEDGLAVVVRGDRYGYADTEGKLAVPLIYDKAVRFRNGRAVVTKRVGEQLKCALIDRSGREITSFLWGNLGNINDGVAVGWTKIDSQRRYSLVDTLGNVVPLEYAQCGDFSNGLAAVGIG